VIVAAYRALPRAASQGSSGLSADVRR
jgi:hypothetical protein